MQIGVETAKAVDQRRVFVLDEDEIVRAAPPFMLHDEIENHQNASIQEAYDKGAGLLKPDVALLGASFLKSNGASVLAELTERFGGVRILIVCDKADEALAVDAMKHGAHGTLVKPLKIENVRQKVDTVLGRGGAKPLVQLGLL
jgi:DNA-binding NarL/FixJ family response regulator